MSAISRLMNEHDTQLWRIIHYYVDHAIEVQDLSHVTMISTDETSAKKGHNYVTIFMDPEKRNVIHVTKGKDAGTWAECKCSLLSLKPSKPSINTFVSITTLGLFAISFEFNFFFYIVWS